METRSAKRKKLLNAQKLDPNHCRDRISDLPDDVLHHILFFLPIKSIAQTSILSKRWKSLWYSFPDLDFTTLASSNSGRKPDSCNLTKYVDQILALIDKRSYIRVLRFRAFLSFSNLNGLIRNAVKHNVQELDVEVSTSDYFNFPRSVLMGGGTLKVLRLKSRNQGFRLPPLECMKDGFRSLSSLSLSRAVLDKPSLVDLFTSSSFPLLKKLQLEACLGLKHLRIKCSALEDLTLQSCSQLQTLEITVRKLRRLRICSCFDVSCTTSWVRIDAPALKSIHWSANSVTEETVLLNLTALYEAFVEFLIHKENISPARIQSVSNLISGISHCRSLTCVVKCIQVLWRLCTFENLKSLELHIELNKYTTPWIANLLRGTPFVHTITIKINYGRDVERRQQWNMDLWESTITGEEIYWESQAKSLKSFLDHLKVVRIHNFGECANDVSLVKFLLKHGRVLQEVVIIWSSICKPRDSLLREKIKSQMRGFCRASCMANIVFQECFYMSKSKALKKLPQV